MTFLHRDPMLAKLRKTHGWRSTEITDYLWDNWPSKEIPGISQVNACPVTARSLDHADTLSMYEKLGFKPTAIDEYRSSDPQHPWHYIVARLKV
ncbi:hypothetical protein [Actinopolymorpha sp. B11F2]|uniref:hypothetical protein n=1 Tax=Actinopolymorpha sp. B11F2 TaxID=3160862 RepID=UPI0032E520B9